ncbi:bromodomain adjacent to zinc finger domain protein 2A isoform X1 [Lissotriton helveticus]
MEISDHCSYTALPPVSNTSNLKPDNLYTNGSLLTFSQQGKGLNGDMNVNGLAAVSPTSTSGTESTNLLHVQHPNVAYDYLWNDTRYPSVNSANPKDNQLVPQLHSIGPYQLNGGVDAIQPASPRSGTFRDPEAWGKGACNSMELGFPSPELYDSFHDESFGPMQNGPTDYYSTPRPSPMLASSVQAFAESPCRTQESNQLGDECVKDILPIAVGETVELESLEPSDMQTDVKLCSYETTPSPSPLDVAIVPPPPDVTSCLDDSSQLSSQLDESHLLSSEGLEPFGTDLSRDSVGGGLYDMEETDSETERASLDGTDDLSALDCTDAPSFANTTSFSILTEDSRNSTSLFAATTASAILEESVMQDDDSDLQSEADVELENDSAPGLNLLLEKNFQNISVEEVVDGSCSDAVQETELVQADCPGNIQRRRATPEEVCFPLKHGWRREVRIKKGSHRWQGETWYYSPCGKRMKQFPEVIKYLSRNPTGSIRREHFSFSPRMPVGDFYEECSSADGPQWVKLLSEEIPSCILAITGKRGRPRNTEKLRAKDAPRLKRGRGRPPKVKAVDLLNKADSKMKMKLEAQEELSTEDKLMLRKIKRRMRRKERNKRKQDEKVAALKEAEKQAKLEKKKEKARKEEEAHEKKANAPEQVKVSARQVERKIQAQRRLEQLAQRRLEDRRRQQLILDEMKKPTEDMCLADHQPLPEFAQIPGLFLPSCAFSNCLAVVEFLHSYGKVLGFDIAKEVPSLCTLQEGLFNTGDSLCEVMDLLIRLLRLVLRDPGLPSYAQSLKVLGEKISELELNRDTVSEVLRIFMEIYGADLEICDSLRSKPFQAHPPETKAAILAFLVNELNGSATIIGEIDKTIENMSKQRRNKWIIEGRLRRLKIALAKKMGRPESEITCMEEQRWRRRSRTVAEEEEDDGGSGMDISKSKEEDCRAKRYMNEDEGASLSSASVLELERQIEKLTKKQTIFRKKLFHASQALRTVSLGQDRYRRRYWVLPYLGGIFIEGMDGTAAEDDFSEEKEESSEPVVPKISPVKAEPTEILLPDQNMCSTRRARGRPRKLKPDSLLLPPPTHPPMHMPLQEQLPQEQLPQEQLPQEQPLSTPPPSPPQLSRKKLKHVEKSNVVNGFFEDSSLFAQSQHDLSQSAFLSWLSQTHNGLSSSPVQTRASTPEHRETTPSPPEEILASTPTIPESEIVDHKCANEGVEKKAPWFHLLPRLSCELSLVDQTHTTSIEVPSPKPCDLSRPTPARCSSPARESDMASKGALAVNLPSLPPSTPIHNTRAHNPLRKLHASTKSPHSSPSRCLGPTPPKRRGRPPTKFFKQIEQKYFTQLTRQPIPRAMQIGWWWIRDSEEFEIVLKALHPRGIREKMLHKHISKHKEYLKEVCGRPKTDPIFQFHPEAGHPVSLDALQKWSITERALEVDLTILQWVEELEQRVVSSDLQLRGWLLPPLDSTREDLGYYEHKVDPLEDITIKLKKEGMELWRVNTHPLDRAVQRLADLELNIERRYLKEPLWVLSEVVTEQLVVTHSEDGEVSQTELEYAITPRLRTWRQTVERCRSAAQLSLCVYQLDKSIAWEKSVNRVTCLVCRKGDNDELLLLCESCDRGCHTYCHRPKISEVPTEDWFCPICISRQADGDYLWPQSSLHRGTKRRTLPPSFMDDSSPKKTMTMRRRDNCGMGVSRYSGEGLSPSKRKRISVRNDDNSDLAFCEIILMEMESQDDAWPFLEPVNPRLVPGYRKVIKKPMDFSTMREKLLTGGYSCCEEFAADAMLVFSNCQMFNEDDSEVGRAGLVMKNFYESRWEEFYRGKLQENA